MKLKEKNKIINNLEVIKDNFIKITKKVSHTTISNIEKIFCSYLMTIFQKFIRILI